MSSRKRIEIERVVTDDEIIVIQKKIIKREKNPSTERKDSIVKNIDLMRKRRTFKDSVESRCDAYGITIDEYNKWKEERENREKDRINQRYYQI